MDRSEAGDARRPSNNRPPEQYDNLIIATRYYHEGFNTAPLTGEIVRDLVVTGESSLPYLSMHRLGRFN